VKEGRGRGERSRVTPSVGGEGGCATETKSGERKYGMLVCKRAEGFYLPLTKGDRKRRPPITTYRIGKWETEVWHPIVQKSSQSPAPAYADRARGRIGEVVSIKGGRKITGKKDKAKTGEGGGMAITGFQREEARKYDKVPRTKQLAGSERRGQTDQERALGGGREKTAFKLNALPARSWKPVIPLGRAGWKAPGGKRAKKEAGKS